MLKKKYKMAMLCLQVAKLKKYTLAQVQIGSMYLEGRGVERSKEKAIECFQQSINEIDPKDCYRQGMVFYKEYRYGISLFYTRRAAEAGYGQAQSQIGIMLLKSKTIRKNHTEAMEWIEKSMESMSPNDCYNQGMAFYRGTTVAKDFAILFRFMEKAVKNMHVLAQAHLGIVYHQGFGIEKSRGEAHYYIGLMYNNGYFVDQDEERAQNYFKMAHIHGIERAKELLSK
jgi:TPR repeat protein